MANTVALDRETNPSFTLTITATDGVNTFAIRADGQITVADNTSLLVGTPFAPGQPLDDLFF